MCDFACLRVIEVRDGLPGQDLWLVMRRNLADPTEIKYYFSNAPADSDPAELVRLSGIPTQFVSRPSSFVTGRYWVRWPVEIIFRAGKVEVGFDHYELRSWLGWHHHMVFAFLAHLFLVRMRIFFKKRAPALTVYQVRLLLLSVLPMPKFDISAAIQTGSTSSNRVHVHHRCMRRKVSLEGGPRRLGGVQHGGGTLKCNSSAMLQQWSVTLAARAGVRCTQRYPCEPTESRNRKLL